MTSWNSMETPARRSERTSVLVGVGAGIAAYKVALVVRSFRSLGFDVHVIPTPASLEFVGEATWKELSENPVETRVFHREGPGHVELARIADLIVLAPATADLLARSRAGMANDLLTATVLASTAPVIAFPAMHTAMWQNAATQDNVATLRERGWTVVDPAVGPLSSGDSGPGRLPDPEEIVALSVAVLSENNRAATDGRITGVLEGKHVVITAGGTREALDPVRYIGNRSSGAQGVELALEAADRGALVSLIVAATSTELPEDDPRIRVSTAMSAGEMLHAVEAELPNTDVLIMCAAVGDFAPRVKSDLKIKKSADDQEIVTIELVHNPDILKRVSVSPNRPRTLIGFGAETGDQETVERLGRQKALNKGADLLAVNQVGETAGFGDVPSALIYFDRFGNAVGKAEGTKDKLAADLLDRAERLLNEGTED